MLGLDSTRSKFSAHVVFIYAPVLLPEVECKPGSLIECELRRHDRKVLGFLQVGTT